MVPVILLFAGPLRRRAFKQRYIKEQPNLTNVQVQIDDTGFRSDIPGIGSGFAEWPGVAKWMEGRSLFILRSGYLMRVVPKSALSPSEQEDLRKLLNSKVGPENTAR